MASYRNDADPEGPLNKDGLLVLYWFRSPMLLSWIFNVRVKRIMINTTHPLLELHL